MGCAVAAGTDVAAGGAFELSPHTRRTPEVPPQRFVDMNILPHATIDKRAALRAMPPVLRGYVRSGCADRQWRGDRPPVPGGRCNSC